MAVAKDDILPWIGHRITVTYQPSSELGTGGYQKVTGLLAVVADDKIGIYVTSGTPQLGPTYIWMSDIVAVQDALMETILQSSILGIPAWGLVAAGVMAIVGWAFWKKRKT